MACLLSCAGPVVAQFYPATVVTDSIDWEDNIEASDRNEYPDPHPAVEVTPSGTIPAVYVRGTEPEATVYFQEFYGQSYSVTLHVTAARYVTLNSQTHTVTVSPSSQTVNLAAGPALTTAGLSVSGIPDAVSGGTLEVKAYMTLNSAKNIGGTNYPAGTIVWGSSSTYQPIGKFLFTDAVPTGVQAMPWTDLLMISCTWAEGETAVANVMGECTRGLFWESLFEYEPELPQYVDRYEDGEIDVFLGDWIEHCLGIFSRDMNCVDVAAILCTMGQAHGYSGITKRVWSGGGFTTNPLCPMGADATNWILYSQEGFRFHQVLAYGNVIFDGTSAQWRDLSGSTYQNPPAAWSLSGYWQTSSTWMSPNMTPYNWNPDSWVTNWARLGLAYGTSTTDECQLTLEESDWEIVELVS